LPNGNTRKADHPPKGRNTGNNIYPGPLGFEEREKLRRRAGVRRDTRNRNKEERELQTCVRFPFLAALVTNILLAVQRYSYILRTPSSLTHHPEEQHILVEAVSLAFQPSSRTCFGRSCHHPILTRYTTTSIINMPPDFVGRIRFRAWSRL
jgi:hypothetical protein